MDEIIVTIPWTCDGADGCLHRWHLGAYWVYEDGTHGYDAYGDGDSEPCDAPDVPDTVSVAKAWRDYFRYVAEAGQDPLRQFSRPDRRQMARRWQVRFANWIGADRFGLRCLGARRGNYGRLIPVSDLPAAVQEYLCLDEQNCLDVAKTAAELAGLSGIASAKGMVVVIDVDEPQKPWSEARLAAYLRRQARELANQPILPAATAASSGGRT